MSNEIRRHVGLLGAISCILGLDRGDDVGITRVAEELTIGLNPWSSDSPEFGLCRGDILWTHSLYLAAGGAGFRSIVQLKNDDARTLMVVEGWVVSAGPAAYHMARTSALATTDNGLLTFARDGRYSRANVPAVRSLSQNGVALPAGFSNGQFLGDMPVNIITDSVPLILGGRFPDTVAWYPSADNVAIRVNAWGRIRRVWGDRELAP